MFCPKCGIGNSVDQKFCRGCGHALAGHKAALENNFEDALEKIKSGATALGISAVVLTVISLMASCVWIFQKDAGAFFILIPVLAFVIPATILGFVRLNRAYRALSAKDRGDSKAIAQSKTTAIQLAAGDTTDPLAQAERAPVSVTEHTTSTLNLPSRLPVKRRNCQVDSPSCTS